MATVRQMSSNGIVDAEEEDNVTKCKYLKVVNQIRSVLAAKP